MKIEISNLGYVKNIKLNLDKDLTILCGPNNTGKTYVAYAIYGLMNFKVEYTGRLKIVNDIKNILKSNNPEIDVIDLLVNNNAKYLEQISKEYISQISKVFASDSTSFKKVDLKIELGDTDILKRKIFEQKIDTNITLGNNISISILKEVGSFKIKNIFITIDNSMRNLGPDINNDLLIDIISNRIFSILIDFVFPKSFIAPAERIAINIFSKELSLRRNVLVDKLLELKIANKADEDPFDLIKRRASRYPSPIRDSLEIAEDLNNFKKSFTRFNNFANEIEKEILKGQVIISKEGEVQFKPDKAKTMKLPIHLTASVVKSLSNLVIYLRHLARPNDFIIIDEPELNLHPDNQILIARIIAKIANNGFKVLISTHSDYIIREFNNLIMLKGKVDLISKYNISHDSILDYNKVGAILFNYEKKKTVNLEVNKTGFEVETIDRVINDLNERSQFLYFHDLK